MLRAQMSRIVAFGIAFVMLVVVPLTSRDDDQPTRVAKSPTAEAVHTTRAGR